MGNDSRVVRVESVLVLLLLVGLELEEESLCVPISLSDAPSAPKGCAGGGCCGAAASFARVRRSKRAARVSFVLLTLFISTHKDECRSGARPLATPF